MTQRDLPRSNRDEFVLVVVHGDQEPAVGSTGARSTEFCGGGAGGGVGHDETEVFVVRLTENSPQFRILRIDAAGQSDCFVFEFDAVWRNFCFGRRAQFLQDLGMDLRLCTFAERTFEDHRARADGNPPAVLTVESLLPNSAATPPTIAAVPATIRARA